MRIGFDSISDLLKHSLLIIIAGLSLVFIFFYVYLPSTTNHGESITVPDLTGMTIEDLDEALIKRNLRFEVSDSSYSSEHPPLTVLQQFPKEGAKVKENRKIYISINRTEPPQISIPDLTIGSIQNAKAVLESFELRMGRISYKPDLAFNHVLEVYYKGQKIEPGTKIPKGSVIDFVVGDGLGRKVFTIQDMVGMPFEDAKIYLLGAGLKLGTLIDYRDSTDIEWIVSRQVPPAGREVRIGQAIDIWVIPSDSLHTIINEEASQQSNDDGN